ncbi:MAG: preprotein translocase subunit SecE [Paracoccus sp.]|jgi:preprotein translocase subunit SecE|uniref:Protein translocase subunit SecE n=1 Tax=Paracoccus hibiscisoli TaxID=2023261 RepID=A0A4U0QXZ0_9RHOB|nr:preprotein translocase subunit SecE [Paracoccus hibiscisoli]MCG6111459.1 preprotein translocase subunit SecE [Paracoccus sp. (in: a-proteobacteria)]ODT59906.1 MAG: preprotein translocase subunit SecE [Paracoccus sp. SCN 68-21]TJZ86740.1 preprotein translocase subunit SecE [Paracoccus hibiscisoli]
MALDPASHLLKEPPVANPVQFINQVRAEAAKITWPTRREVITTTIMVLIFASITSLFFFLVDLAIRTGLTQGLRLISG